MNWYLGIAMTGFAFGFGWFAAQTLWGIVVGFIAEDDDD